MRESGPEGRQRPDGPDCALGRKDGGLVTAPRPSIAVLGAGSWATAVASIVARNAPTVMWARSPEVAAEINHQSRNTRYTGDRLLPPNLRATPHLAEAVAEANMVVVGIPARGFRAVLAEAAAFIRPRTPIVSLVKGLEQGSDLRMTEIVAELLPGCPAGVLAGPNIAQEIVEGYAAAATLAMPDLGLACRLAEVFRTSRYRVYSSTDVVGVELCGALKNVFAIAAGMADGAGAGYNTKAMVITRSLREMATLGSALGGEPATFNGLAGNGDLIVTCMSPLSRNRRLGEALGRGLAIAEALATIPQVAEGAGAVGVVKRLADQQGVEAPTVREVDAVVNRGARATDAYRGLLRDAPGHETHGHAW
ncbi:NAD(P)H-dependent glycerol-3-phosphate dehydrogenase [Nocardia nova]|uniref:Glycerol-3-phosphate dehydrogenase [NAD(P)+] n=1 Tax=Nocardia nova TaxID=37330 RepID=A0A2T2ZCA8_9NOCA|nr:NAD(P)H-dependent glycerol-3-phosphate dehydrogenase [Nocardia nova]